MLFFLLVPIRKSNLTLWKSAGLNNTANIRQTDLAVKEGQRNASNSEQKRREIRWGQGKLVLLKHVLPWVKPTNRSTWLENCTEIVHMVNYAGVKFRPKFGASSQKIVKKCIPWPRLEQNTRWSVPVISRKCMRIIMMPLCLLLKTHRTTNLLVNWTGYETKPAIGFILDASAPTAVFSVSNRVNVVMRAWSIVRRRRPSRDVSKFLTRTKRPWNCAARFLG